MDWVQRKVSVLLACSPTSLNPRDNQTPSGSQVSMNSFTIEKWASFEAKKKKNSQGHKGNVETEPASHFKCHPITHSGTLHLLYCLWADITSSAFCVQSSLSVNNLGSTHLTSSWHHPYYPCASQISQILWPGHKGTIFTTHVPLRFLLFVLKVGPFHFEVLVYDISYEVHLFGTFFLKVCLEYRESS